jgi:GT2 family glycosyltransferase
MSRYEVLRDCKRGAFSSVGIPVYNGSHRVAWLLESLQNAGGLEPSAVITLLDDGSPKPGETEKLVELAERFDTNLIRHPSNLGITASWNDLVEHTPSTHCVLLNDDLLLSPGWHHNLIYFLENNECGAVGLNLYFCDPGDVPQILAQQSVVPRHPITRKPEPERLQENIDEEPGVVMCAPGCAFAFTRAVFNELGGFDEAMVMTHNESDFGTAAAAKLQVPSYVIPAPKVWHLWSQSFKENRELHPKMRGDHQAYIRKWGGDFQGPNGTHPRFMVGTMQPRTVKWLDAQGHQREKELTIQ